MGFNGGNGPIATIEAVKIFGATYDEATETADYSATDPRWDMSFFYGDVYVDGKELPHKFPNLIILMEPIYHSKPVLIMT